MNLSSKIWFIPPRVLTTDILLEEFDTTFKLIYQIEDKYHSGKLHGKSTLIRRFFGYQPYVFLRNKIVLAEIVYRTNSNLIEIPKSVLMFGESYYNPNNKIIQDQCSEVFDYWQDMGNTDKVTELSMLTTNEIRNELEMLFTMYKEKYGL